MSERLLNYYPHHIGDFNNATRHLTRVERALYRELIELYYDTEKPLPSDDFEWICRKVLASSETEKVLVQNLLGEFFALDGKLFRNDRCDEEIAVFKSKRETAVRAGRASAKKRYNGKSTRVQQAFNWRATNQEPRTSNQEPITKDKEHAKPSRLNGARHASQDDSPILEKLPLREGGEFEVRQSLVTELEPSYPAVDIAATLREMRGWLVLNTDRRKTRRGVRRFICTWLQGEQEKHGG